ncbi:SdiA-regulated domain-containing protein [Roseateles oligotrophus]|uniref:SdiA-regulated domain-containing protein n=1 Tax=Roseateles oligotrophus TaxID=1769250 RepID=A0ABT2YCM6_9BURK|nr:SdiA-regulated domain-containing protein [Roseateles oligotrophus]MCV2367799.1 SdiA-regulated domain-containing protein [Roseateles oligotrophus]
MKLKHLILALVALQASSGFAQAGNSINLANYQVSAGYALDILAGAGAGAGQISGLEASAVTYARDRGTLFFVGDEGTGVVEISRTGQTLGKMSFDWTGSGSKKHDTEGLAYLGGGVLVVSEERLQDVYKFSFANGGSALLKNSFVSIANDVVGNNGIEGISYDARNGGSFVTIKQQTPQNILAGSLTFAAATGNPPSTSGDGSTPPGGGVASMSSLFDPTLMGLGTLSDVQTLSSVDALLGSAAADNLLVLSLGSRKLVEVNRQGQVLSSFDLGNVLPNNGIEGVTIDELGNIYLVAEQDQTGGAALGVKSQLIVLSAMAPVPEPATYGLMALGLGLLGLRARRRQA